MRKIDSTHSYEVDAGNVSAVDAGFIEQHGAGRSKHWQIVSVSAGRNLVVLHTDDCWNGVVSVVGVVDAPSGYIVIGDVCYGWSGPENEDRGRWGKFLQYTNHLDDYKGHGVCLNTGGDGLFEVTATIRELPPLVEEVQ